MQLRTFLAFQGLIFTFGLLGVVLLYFWVDPTQNTGFFLFLMSIAFFLAGSMGVSLVSFLVFHVYRRGFVTFKDMVRIMRRSIFVIMAVLCCYLFDRLNALELPSFVLIVVIFLLLELFLSKMESSHSQA